MRLKAKPARHMPLIQANFPVSAFGDYGQLIALWMATAPFVRRFLTG
jgi:hypothetical protein